MTVSDSSLTDKAREIARCLSYNGNDIQAEAKQIIREMAHRIDSRDIRVHEKKDGLLLINTLGAARFMTLKERFAYRLFDAVPNKF